MEQPSASASSLRARVAARRVADTSAEAVAKSKLLFQNPCVKGKHTFALVGPPQGVPRSKLPVDKVWNIERDHTRANFATIPQSFRSSRIEHLAAMFFFSKGAGQY